MLDPHLLSECRSIVRNVSDARMAGQNVPTVDKPHSTLLRLLRGNKIVKGPQKGYVDFWKTWPSWHGQNGVRARLAAAGYTETQIVNELMGEVYDGVCYGILTLARTTSDDKILVGLRSTKIAGEYGGFISLPGGLVHPNEPLVHAATRQVTEEIGPEFVAELALNDSRITCGEHTSAPSFTFIVEGTYAGKTERTHQSTGVDILEWGNKGKLVWLPRSMLAQAIADKDMRHVIGTFREAGLNVPDTTQLAGDIIAPIRELLL